MYKESHFLVSISQLNQTFWQSLCETLRILFLWHNCYCNHQRHSIDENDRTWGSCFLFPSETLAHYNQFQKRNRIYGGVMFYRISELDVRVNLVVRGSMLVCIIKEILLSFTAFRMPYDSSNVPSTIFSSIVAEAY